MDLKAAVVKFLLAYAVVTTGIVFVVTRAAPAGPRAVVGMGVALLAIWVILLGGAMYLLRDQIRSVVVHIPLPWWLRFFLFFLGLALLEEAITTTLTNLAPLFGAKIGEAYITASMSYLDVIFYHSVIVFLPALIAWTWLLSRYDFSPFEAFLLWGLFGLLAEVGFSGPGQLPAFGFWIFVYGLMIWLPAYTLPQRTVRPARFYHYLLPFVLPLLGLALLFVLAAVLGKIFPGSYFAQLQSHPKLHFPPIK